MAAKAAIITILAAVLAAPVPVLAQAAGGPPALPPRRPEETRAEPLAA